MTPPASSHRGPREWDAEVYHRVSDKQFDWGLEVLERLDLEGDEVVLDAGCGTGRVTAVIAERVSRGRVIAVDGSDSMVAKARETLVGRAEVLQADLVALRLGEPVDAIFSNAVFHWISDHDLLFMRLHDALRPDGRLVAQCGGEGNVAALAAVIEEVLGEEPFRSTMREIPRMWNFASPEQTSERLEGAGFAEVHCWSELKTVTPDDPAGFLGAVSLGPYIERLPEGGRSLFVERVIERMDAPLTLDYVRLNISATRPG